MVKEAISYVLDNMRYIWTNFHGQFFLCVGFGILHINSELIDDVLLLFGDIDAQCFQHAYVGTCHVYRNILGCQADSV